MPAKALSNNIAIGIDELGSLANGSAEARLRHLTMLRMLEPGRSAASMARKLSGNLGISKELAEIWVIRHREIGDVPFIGMDRLEEHRSGDGTGARPAGKTT